jgi:hypothetical protein
MWCASGWQQSQSCYRKSLSEKQNKEDLTMNRKFSHLSILIVILSFFSLSIQTHAAPLAGVTTRVSLASDGTQGNGMSSISSISAVALSEAERLAPESYTFNETPISSGPADYEPDVTVDVSGNGYAVWVANSCTEIRFAFLPSGGKWGPSEVVAPARHEWCPYYPKVEIDGGGNVYVVWMDIPPGVDPNCHYNVCNWDIWFAYRPSSGGWTAPTTVNNDLGATRQMYPEIVVDLNGNAQAIWKDEREGQCNIFSSYRPEGGSWSGNVKVNDSASCEMGIWGDGLGLALVGRF